MYVKLILSFALPIEISAFTIRTPVLFLHKSIFHCVYFLLGMIPDFINLTCSMKSLSKVKLNITYLGVFVYFLK